MSILLLHMSLPTSITQPMNVSFSRSMVTTPNSLFFHSQFSQLSLHSKSPPKPSPIRMGGGPRTFPGGVSKWQWKRMQAKKAKQLLKARLCRERQIYELRKRAEMKAAVAELEKPWEVVERAPILFSVKADEQLKVLADRFQKAGGFDMWSERDGPQLFDLVDDDLPSARFFPKGVVHSTKPYQQISDMKQDSLFNSDSEDEIEIDGRTTLQVGNGSRSSMRKLNNCSSSDDDDDDDEKQVSSNSTESLKSKNINGKAVNGDATKKISKKEKLISRRRTHGQFRKGNTSVKLIDLNMKDGI